MALELESGTVTAKYLWAMNLVCAVRGMNTRYYLYNGHGDVVQLTDTSGTVTRNYDYDAFGVETDPDEDDTNPFRYCGEYYDTETGRYYLRARYYDPTTGRFASEDTHWNPGNMIYGDNLVKWNEREAGENDPLALNTYTYVPDAIAIRQSGNLYTYCVGNPVAYIDPHGESILFAGAMVILAAAFLVVFTAALILDPNFINAMNHAIAAVLDDIQYLADKYNENKSEIIQSLKDLAGAGTASPNPDGPQQDPNKSIRKIDGNTEANKIAKQNGYENAEALKAEYVGSNNVSKFNIFRNTRTGELILKPIQGNTIIPTGLFG